MANTYTSLNYHIVFSTKNRQHWLDSNVRERLWPYLGGIARDNGMKSLQIGGISDHVHILISMPSKPTFAIKKITIVSRHLRTSIAYFSNVMKCNMMSITSSANLKCRDATRTDPAQKPRAEARGYHRLPLERQTPIPARANEASAIVTRHQMNLD